MYLVNMRLVLFFTAAVAVACYDEKFDKMDVDAIIADDNLFMKYINCFLDKGPCDVEHSTELRELFPDMVTTACAKCTPAQRVYVRKTTRALQDKSPELFIEFRDKYDPERKYEKDFINFVTATE